MQFDFPNAEGKPYKSSGGKLIWDEPLKRYVPEGWQSMPFSDIADIKNGATPSTADEKNYGEDIVWVTPKDLSDSGTKYTYDSARHITQKGYDSCSTTMLPIGTVLMSSRAPIGLLSIAETTLCTNQGFKSIIPYDTRLTQYLYYYLQINMRKVDQLGTGTTFKEVSRDDLLMFPVLKIGDNNLIDKWYEVSDKIAQEQVQLQRNTDILIKLRDELLSLLMNGQATVNYDLSSYHNNFTHLH